MTTATYDEEIRLISDMSSIELFERAERGIPMVQEMLDERGEVVPEEVMLMAAIGIMAFTAFCFHFCDDSEEANEKSADVINAIVMAASGGYRAGTIGFSPETRN